MDDVTIKLPLVNNKRRNTGIWLLVTQSLVAAILLFLTSTLGFEASGNFISWVLILPIILAVSSWILYRDHKYWGAAALTSLALGILLAVMAVLMWLAVLINVMPAGEGDIKSEVLPLLILVVYGVPLSVVIFVLCSVRAVVFLDKKRVRPAFFLVLVSWGVIVLPWLPLLAYSAFNPGARYSLFPPS